MAGCGSGANYQQEFQSIDANNDGFISQQEYAAARGGGGGGGNGGNGGGAGGDCEDCVQVVKTTKKVRVPCHRNTYKQYTVKVPRQVTEQVPRTVNYTEMENRSKCVPYTEMKCEQRIRLDTQKYQVPVQKCVTKMVSVTRKVPKTIYVDVTTQVPKQETVTTMEDRTKLVKIPYSVQVPVQKFRTVNYQEPVKKQKTIMEKRCRTVFDTQVRTRCEPKVTYVTKEIPVYNVVARPAAPCPPNAPCGQNGGGSGGQGFNGGGAAAGGGQYATEFRSIDANGDGGISLAEYSAARTGFAAPQGGAAAAGGGMAGGGGAAAGGGASYGAAAGGGGASYGAAAGGGGASYGAAAGGGASYGAAAGGGGASFGAGGGQGFNAGGASGGANYAAEFRSLDTNRDGKMSLAEYTAARQGGAGGAASGGCAPCGQ